MRVYTLNVGSCKHTIYKTGEGRFIGFAKQHTTDEMSRVILTLVEYPDAYLDDPPGEVYAYKDKLTLIHEF